MSDAVFATAADLLGLGRIWLFAGLVVAAAFLGYGLDRVAPAARGAWAFRPLLVPGLLLLWPLVLWRWSALERGAAGAGQPPSRAVHRVAWSALAAVLPAILLAAFLQRAPGEPPSAVRLDAPGAAP